MTRTLLETARAATRGEATAAEVFEAFIAATVFSPAPPQPGVHVVELGGQRVVPVFTSEAELARFMGVTNWFSTTGADLLHLLPPGVSVGLDIAAPHRLHLNPRAVSLERLLYLRTPAQDGD